MDRLLEFAGNHLFLVTLFFALLILLIWNLSGGVVWGVQQVEPSDLTRLINRDRAVVLDVRPAEEYQGGHILNAINIPDAELSERQKELEKARDKPLVAYCNNGGISRNTARRLKALGFENIQCLNGGLAAWRNAGLPVTRENG